jgi:hypothetical protein
LRLRSYSVGPATGLACLAEAPPRKSPGDTFIDLESYWSPFRVGPESGDKPVDAVDKGGAPNHVEPGRNYVKFYA